GRAHAGPRQPRPATRTGAWGRPGDGIRARSPRHDRPERQHGTSARSRGRRAGRNTTNSDRESASRERLATCHLRHRAEGIAAPPAHHRSTEDPARSAMTCLPDDTGLNIDRNLTVTHSRAETAEFTVLLTRRKRSAFRLSDGVLDLAQ